MCTRWEQNYSRLNWKEVECHEAANSVTIVAIVKPHILDQSNKEVTKLPRSWSGELDISSKILKFLSRHTVHIRHIGIKFQMWEWCLPNQLYHLNNKSTTCLGRTQWMRKETKTKFQSFWAALQCNNKWSTISPSQRHIQYHPAIVCPHRIRLSQVKMRPKAVVQIKNATLGGALTRQMLFQGNLTPLLSIKA